MTQPGAWLLKHYRERSLGARLILFMVLSSTLLSLLATAVQLYFSYQRDLSDTQKSFDIFEQSFESSLATAVWQFNFKQVGVILDGVAAYKDVVYVDLATTTGQHFTSGTAESGAATTRTRLPLVHIDPQGTEVLLGELRVDLTHANAQRRVLSQFWTLLATNAAKTSVASVVMLVLFHILVAKHLRRIAAFVRQFDLTAPRERLRLIRSPLREPDDLDYVVSAINEAQDRLRESYDTVECLNQNLETTNEHLKRSNEQLQSFAYVAAHDLQEPVRKIGAFGDLLLEEYGEALDGDARAYIENMVDAAVRQQALVKALLAYSEVESQAHSRERVDLGAVLEVVLRDLSMQINETRALVQIDPLPAVLANRVQMRQIFSNLILNALKYRSPERPPVICVRSEGLPSQSDADDNKGRCRVTVEDNGIGFDQSRADEIFEPFKRLHPGTAHQGVGLGLAIIKRIMAHHKGSVSAQGRPGEGATFTIILPLAESKERSFAA